MENNRDNSYPFAETFNDVAQYWAAVFSKSYPELIALGNQRIALGKDNPTEESATLPGDLNRLHELFGDAGMPSMNIMKDRAKWIAIGNALNWEERIFQEGIIVPQVNGDGHVVHLTVGRPIYPRIELSTRTFKLSSISSFKGPYAHNVPKDSNPVSSEEGADVPMSCFHVGVICFKDGTSVYIAEESLERFLMIWVVLNVAYFD